MNLVDACKRYAKRITKLMKDLNIKNFHYEDPFCFIDGVSVDVFLIDDNEILFSNMVRRIAISNSIRTLPIKITDLNSYFEALQKVYDSLTDLKEHINFKNMSN